MTSNWDWGNNFFFWDLQLYLPIIGNNVLLLQSVAGDLSKLFKEDPHFQIANKYSYNQWRICKFSFVLEYNRLMFF